MESYKIKDQILEAAEHLEGKTQLKENNRAQDN